MRAKVESSKTEDWQQEEQQILLALGGLEYGTQDRVWKMRSPAAAEFCGYSGRPVHLGSVLRLRAQDVLLHLAHDIARQFVQEEDPFGNFIIGQHFFELRQNSSFCQPLPSKCPLRSKQTSARSASISWNIAKRSDEEIAVTWILGLPT